VAYGTHVFRDASGPAFGAGSFHRRLDEKRSGRGDRDTVDAMVEKLFAINPRKARISCRAADRLGESDLKALRPYFEPSGDPPVVLLERLSREEQRAVLTTQGMEAGQADKFLAQAEERGLGDFLENRKTSSCFGARFRAVNGRL
jgi:predicted NACHT family NTPase